MDILNATRKGWIMDKVWNFALQGNIYNHRQETAGGIWSESNIYSGRGISLLSLCLQIYAVAAHCIMHKNNS
jgi:hypothetical protein